MQETWVRFLGWEDPLEKGMATYSNILAWRIPWTGKPGGLQSLGVSELDMTEQLTLLFHFKRNTSQKAKKNETNVHSSNEYQFSKMKIRIVCDSLNGSHFPVVSSRT